MKVLGAVSIKMTKLPSFHYLQTYQTDLNTLEKVVDIFFNSKFKDGLYFRGMARYEYICISTFYRYYVSLYPDIQWHDVKLGFGKVVSLPKIDMQKYRELSFDILDEFEKNLAQNGIDDLEFESIIYFAQHYGLPTNLIDFTTNPKVALYFACSDAEDSDCSVYMYDIYSHIKGLAQYMAIRAKQNGDDKEFEYFYEELTKIDKETSSIATPQIQFEDIAHNTRIQKQKGVFVYHCEDEPFDNLIYLSSKRTAFERRRVFKIKATLKKEIIQILDERYGINQNYLFPDELDDKVKTLIIKAVDMTKNKCNIPKRY